MPDQKLSAGPQEGHRMRLLLKAALFGTAAAVAVLALYPRLQLPEPALTRGWTDLLEHGLAFLVLSVLAGLLWRPLWRVAGSLALAAAAIELLQIAIPGREVSAADLAAGLAGLALGLAAIALLARRHQTGEPVVSRATQADAAVEG